MQVLKPSHEQIILLHLSGLKNVDIATALGISDQTVSNILGDEKAMELIAVGKENIKKNLLAGIDDKLVLLAHKSLSNLEKTVNADIPVKHRAKIHQDRVGVDLLKMLGYGEGPKEDSDKKTITPELANRLTTALERAEKVREIVIEDAVYEVVPAEEKKERKTA